MVRHVRLRLLKHNNNTANALMYRSISLLVAVLHQLHPPHCFRPVAKLPLRALACRRRCSGCTDSGCGSRILLLWWKTPPTPWGRPTGWWLTHTPQVSGGDERQDQSIRSQSATFLGTQRCFTVTRTKPDRNEQINKLEMNCVGWCTDVLQTRLFIYYVLLSDLEVILNCFGL